MTSIVNKIFSILKYILLIISFVLTLYIVIYMYHRLNKSLIQSYKIFIPFIIIFVLFCINFLFNKKKVQKNLFYNITCCLVFCLIIFVDYRTIFDTYMLANSKLGYNINFNYFNDFLIPLKIMLYGLSITNILLMINFKSKKNLTVKI
ncbi:MAG: hypothetical protein ACI4OT_01280 [Bacilli bacterium]